MPQPSVPPVAEAAHAHRTEVKCALEMDALCPEEKGDRAGLFCNGRQPRCLSLVARCCATSLRRMKENWQQLRVACEADRRQFCREVPSAGGELLLQCLESHAQEVSDQCFQFFQRGRLLN